MKLGEARSLVHNIADSLASGIGLMIGVYQMDVFGESGASPDGLLTVDFLTGRVVHGQASPQLADAVRKYSEAFPEHCRRHNVEPSAFRRATATYGTDASQGPHFTVAIEDTIRVVWPRTAISERASASPAGFVNLCLDRR